MSFPDVTPEPKKIFLGLLINRLADIEDRIYISHKFTSSVDAMKGIIDSLDEHSKKALSKEYERLAGFGDGRNWTKEEVQEIYRSITNYLHRTYLQEINIGLIPASVLPATEKLPDKEPIPKRVDARL